MTYGAVGQAVFIAFALIWLKEMPKRWRSDWEDFRNAKEVTERLVLGLIWFVTLWLAVSVVKFVVTMCLRFATM